MTVKVIVVTAINTAVEWITDRDLELVSVFVRGTSTAGNIILSQNPALTNAILIASSGPRDDVIWTGGFVANGSIAADIGIQLPSGSQLYLIATQVPCVVHFFLSDGNANNSN